MLVRDIREGDHIESVYLVERASKRVAKNGKEYLKIEVRDKSASIEAVAWDETMERNPDCRSVGPGDYVSVVGRANLNRYANKVEIILDSLTVISPDRVNPADFLPVTNKDIGALKDRLRQLIDMVENGYLRDLLEKMFSDDAFAEKYYLAPAAKNYHHAYLGGLLEHSVAVGNLAVVFCQAYEELDLSLLLAGAILHDVGKIEEFEFRNRIDYSTSGRLRGHIVIGNEIVSRAIAKIKGFPPDLEMHLSHLILSHQGELEHGAAVRPKTREAVVLNLIDNADAKINGFMLIAGKYGPEAEWSDYQSLFSDYLYLGSPKEVEAEQLPLIPE